MLVRLLAQCGERLQGDLRPLLDVTFERIDDALYDLADKAESDRLYTAYFDALRLVRRERPSLKRRFLRNVDDTLTLFQDARNTFELSADSAFDSEDLALVDDEDLEESLALSNMISKADARYDEPLRELTRHFAELIGYRALKIEDIPLSPQAICSAFNAAVKSVPDIRLATALVIYKTFDKQVMDNLGATYAACVEHARAQGLRAIYRPEAPARNQQWGQDGRPAPRTAGSAGNRPPQGTASATQASPPATGGYGRYSREEVAIAVISFDQLRRLLDVRGAGRAEDSSLPVIGRADLLRVLTSIARAAAAPGDQPLAPSQLRGELVDSLRVASGLDDRRRAKAAERRLERADADTMDLVFLLFEQVLAAPDIPDALKVPVSRLQIPYVKLTLTDRTFFDEPEHPARRLLNQMAAAAIGWNDDGDRSAGSLYGMLQHIVERVVTELDSEPRLFDQLNAALDAFLRDNIGDAQVNELCSVREAGARAERENLRRRVVDTIAERLDARAEVPGVVAAILHDGWSAVLLKVLAQQGEGSRGWRHALRHMDRLLWSVEPKRDPAERRELLRHIPELVRVLREELGTVVADQRLVARWLKELQTLHIAVLRGPGLPAAASAAADAAGPALGAGAATTAVAEAAVNVDAIALGTWLGIARDDGVPLRVKLAWRSADGASLLLVDRFGRKGFELARQDLETLLEQNLAEIIGDGGTPLVDRALAALGRSLTIH